MEDEIHARDVVIRLFDPHHVSKIAAEIEVCIRADGLPVFVFEAVDKGRNFRQTGDHVGGILEHGFPVLILLHSFCIFFCENGFLLHCEHGGGEHRHGMGIFRHCPENIKNVGRHFCAGLPVFYDFHGLLHGGNFAGQKEGPEALDVRVFTPRDFGKGRESFRDCFSTKADSFLWVQVRDVGYQAADIAGTTDALLNCYLIDDGVSLFFHEFLNARLMSFDFF